MKKPDWADRVERNTAPFEKGVYYFDWEEAHKRVEFIEAFCRYPEGPKAGQLVELDQWQKEEVIYPAFGWKESATGLRRFRQVFLFIPRKNAKTTLVSFLGLSVLFQDGEQRAQLYCAAAERGQAKLIYDALTSMVNSEPRLLKRLNVYKNELKYPKYDSYLKVLSAEAGSKHGFNSHAVFFDELHTQKKRDLWDVLNSSMLSREQPITFVMTTAGTDVNSLCYEQYEYAKKVRDGIIEDDRILPIIYEAEAGDDWHDPKVWKKANPGLGTTISEKNFRIEYDKAAKNPAAVNTFLNLHLNMWTTAAERWITDDDWKACAGGFSMDEVKDLPCWAGLDLASTRDLNAFSALWVDKVRRKYYLKVWHFVNRATATDKNMTKGVDYLDFQSEGSVIITEGNATDYDFIYDWISKFSEENKIESIAYDRQYASYIAPKLAERGLRVEPFGQGWVSLSFPTKQFEIEVMKRNIVHNGERCMRWQMGNVTLQRSVTGDVKVIKDRAKPHKKVDGVVSSIMAFGIYLHERQEESAVVPSVKGLDF